MLERITRVRNTMSAYGIHTLVVCNPKHVYYLSGFHTIARPIMQIGQTCCVLSLDGTWKLFLPAPWGSEFSSFSGCVVVEYSGHVEELGVLIRECLSTDSRSKAASDLTWMSFKLAKTLFHSFQDLTILDEHPILAKCRMVKDTNEIQYLRQAAAILDKGLIAAEQHIHIGNSELEIQAAINAAMILEGSEGNGFTTKVIGGANGSHPHHVTSTNRLKFSDTVIVDLSSTVLGYESDSARTFSLPEPGTEAIEVHHGITELLEALPQQLIPGTPLRELASYIRSQLAKIHPLAQQAETIGHGTGLFANEYPYISTSSTEVLKENMILAIEPALYLPGHFGIRIENMYLIDKHGGQVLNRFPLRATQEGAKAWEYTKKQAYQELLMPWARSRPLAVQK